MSKEEGGEVEMDHEDVRKVEVYKERREYWKRGEERERQREREALEEESGQDHIYTNPVSLGTPVQNLIFMFLWIKARFLLVHVLGQSPLLLFFPISYKVYWFGPGLKGTTHCSKWD